MIGGSEKGGNDRVSETELLAFRHGSLEAFEALFRTHQRTVYGWLLRIVRDVNTAEDLTLETFVRIYRAHARLDPARGFEGWARTIATRAALDWLRRTRDEKALTVEMDEDPPAPSPGDAAVSAEIRRGISLAMGRLAAKLRIAAQLAVAEQRPQREVAEALDISASALKVRVFRAMRLLSKDLQQQGIRP